MLGGEEKDREVVGTAWKRPSREPVFLRHCSHWQVVAWVGVSLVEDGGDGRWEMGSGTHALGEVVVRGEGYRVADGFAETAALHGLDVRVFGLGWHGEIFRPQLE